MDTNTELKSKLLQVQRALVDAQFWLRVDCAIEPGMRRPDNHGPSDALANVVHALELLPTLLPAAPSVQE